MDHAKMVRQTADGGFVIAGSRADEFPTDGQYEADVLLIKTDADGNEVWTQTYRDKILSAAWAVEQAPDGGYITTGWEARTYNDRDVIAIKTDELGDVEWSQVWNLDPDDRDGGYDMILTRDGHIVIACIQSLDRGGRHAVLIKTDLQGNEVWVKDLSIKGIGTEFWDIMEDTDGGYVISGDIIQGIAPTTGQDKRSGLVIKTDPEGEILWQWVFENDAFELNMFSSAVVLPDGGYVFVGRAILQGERYADMLWLKLAADSEVITPSSE